MKGILEFNTEDPDEKASFQRASRADDAFGVLDKILARIREHRKYGAKVSLNEIQNLIIDEFDMNKLWY